MSSAGDLNISPEATNLNVFAALWTQPCWVQDVGCIPNRSYVLFLFEILSLGSTPNDQWSLQMTIFRQGRIPWIWRVYISFWQRCQRKQVPGLKKILAWLRVKSNQGTKCNDDMLICIYITVYIYTYYILYVICYMLYVMYYIFI